MNIDEKSGVVIFDNLLSANRDLGSEEKLQAFKPAEKAVAENAKGTFCTKSLADIHASAKAQAQSLKDALTT